jgi:hypothetical protein
MLLGSCLAWCLGHDVVVVWSVVVPYRHGWTVPNAKLIVFVLDALCLVLITLT